MTHTDTCESIGALLDLTTAEVRARRAINGNPMDPIAIWLGEAAKHLSGAQSHAHDACTRGLTR